MKTIVFKNIISGFLFFMLIISNSCSEGFLERPPYGVQTADNYYKSIEELEGAVVSVYNAIQTGGFGSLDILTMVFGNIGSDDALKGGESESDQAAWQDISMSRQLSSNSAVSGLWSVCYSGIAAANIVIDKSVNVEYDQESVTRIVNEAKFIRGLCYYKLVVNFGDIPLITNFLEPKDILGIERSPAAAVWEQIKLDFEAATNLPSKSEWGADGIGRATSGAAWTMLGKSYLNQGKTVEAENSFKQVIQSQEYSLVQDYGSIFRNSGENNSESIFEIQHMAGVTGNENTFFVILQTSRDNGAGGWGFNCPTQDLVDEFEPGDPRAIYTVIFPGDIFPKNDGSNYVVANAKSPSGYHNRKYFKSDADRVPSLFDQGVNWRLLRYSDVLLSYAEVLNENNKPTEALTFLNMVRQRARQTPSEDPMRTSSVYDLTYTGELLPEITTINKNELREKIWHERRVELAMEGHRREDLIRTEKFKERMEAAKDGLTVDESKHLFLPIPLSEIDATNGILIQNPGY